MRTKENKKGISLIVLIITIIVVIILAAVVILTLSKNNPIESAKEARFKEDIRTFQDELAMTVSKQYANAGGHRDGKISTRDYEEIKEYIPSFSEKYKNKFVIQDDQLMYVKTITETQKKWCKDLNVKLLYTELEYLESTGIQAVNTNIYIKNTDIIEVIMQDEKHDKTWENWFGTIDNQFGLVRYTNKNIQSFEISGKEISINTTDIFTSKTKIIFDLPNKKITFNDNKEFRFTQNPLVQTTYSVYIFSKLRNITASSSGGEIYDVPGSFKLYSFSVKDSTTNKYRYNLIPVLDYNNIPCLYDTVNRNFLYNETDTNLLYKLKE